MFLEIRYRGIFQACRPLRMTLDNRSWTAIQWATSRRLSGKIHSSHLYKGSIEIYQNVGNALHNLQSWEFHAMFRGRDFGIVAWVISPRAIFGFQRNKMFFPRSLFSTKIPYYGEPLWARGGGPRVVVSTAAFHAFLGGLKETKLFLPHPRVKVSIVGSLRDREVACSASDRQGSNFESCVWRTVSSQSSHHPQEVLLAQFSLYVHKGGLKPDSFLFSVSER